MLCVETELSAPVNWLLEKLAKKAVVQKPRAPKQELASTKTKELELWYKWKNGGEKPEDLDPLLESMNRLLMQRAGKHFRAEIPKAAIIHEHKERLVDGLRTYNPNKGATLGTHVYNKLLKAGRYVDARKNPARSPENVYRHFGAYNKVKSALTEQLGYEPDTRTIHDHIIKTKHPDLGHLSLRQINRVERDQRKNLIEAGYENTGYRPKTDVDFREAEVLKLVYHDLSPEERTVYDHTFGTNGKSKLTSGKIARTMGVDPSKVSKIRTKIYKKMQPHLAG